MQRIFPRTVAPITRHLAKATEAAAPHRSAYQSYPRLKLLGIPHLERLTGPSILNLLIRRNFKTLASERMPETASSDKIIEAPAKIRPKPIIETYKSVLQSLMPRFEKLGFTESSQSNEINLYNAKYSIHIYNLERFEVSYLSISFVGAHYGRSDNHVMNLLAPSKLIEREAAHKKLVQKYLESKEGLSENFEKELIELQLGQLIEFVEKYDQQIAEL